MINKEKCTGCGACAQKCPQSAISMQEDEDGFLIPVKELSQCTKCGNCISACPAQIETWNQLRMDEYYAVQAEDAVRERASSGGVFEILAHSFMEKGGYVCGVIMDENLNVKHVVTQEYKVLLKMLGAKYVQSVTGNCYKEIEVLLDRGEKVLFSGVPCQVAGLKSFLEKEYENLITIDLICQGAAPGSLLKRYVQESFDKRVRKISFRDKSYYRWSSAMNIYFEDGMVYRETPDRDPYAASYVNGFSLRNSCGENCTYNDLPRRGDITLGDFWGIDYYEEKIARDENDGRVSLADNIGTSVVSLNTEKGKDYFLEHVPAFRKVVPVSLREAAYNNRLNGSLPYDKKKRNRFFKLLKNHTVSYAYEHVSKDRYDIGLVGLWNTPNYGAMITARALYELMENMGYQVLLVDSLYQLGVRREDDLTYLTEYCNVSKRYGNTAQMYELNQKCDGFLVGSDQCWNQEINRLFEDTFLLNFAADSKKKLSFATSFGFQQLFFDENTKSRMEYWLKRFDGVSVRETSGVEICEREFGIRASWVLDPIFLRSIDNYKKDAQRSEREEISGYGLNYILDIRENTKQILDTIHSSTDGGKKVVTVLGLDATNAYNISLGNVLEDVNVYDFIKLYLECDYVVTDSYHGMCLAILFHKPFRVILNVGRGKTRFETILNKFGMGHRAVDWDKRDKVLLAVTDDIDWESVERKLCEMKEDSLNWLSTALGRERVQEISENDMLKEQILQLFCKQKSLEEEVDWLKNKLGAEIDEKRNMICKVLKFYFHRRIEYGQKIAFRGGGMATQKLLEIILPILEERRVEVVIYDCLPKKIVIKKHVFQCELPEKIKEKNYDMYVVSSPKYHREFGHEIRQMGYGESLVDIYEELGLDDRHPFWQEKDEA